MHGVKWSVLQVLRHIVNLHVVTAQGQILVIHQWDLHSSMVNSTKCEGIALLNIQFVFQHS